MAGAFGPTSGDSWSRLRLSDQERDAAARELGDHFAAGRLTTEEHDQRLDRILAAKTRGELPGIFADLPSPYAGPRRIAQPASGAPAWAQHYRRSSSSGSGGLRPVKVVLAVIVALLVFTHLPFIVMLGLAWLTLSVARRRRRAARAMNPPYWARP